MTSNTSPILPRRLPLRGAPFIVALVLGLAACKDDSKPAIDQPLVIKTIGLKGTATQAANVRINQQTDQDSTADQSWQALFQLSGQIGPNSLPTDDNTARSITLDVKATHVSDGEADRTRVTLAIDPAATATK